MMINWCLSDWEMEDLEGERDDMGSWIFKKRSE
jgi:hypothetical protein